MIQRVALAVRQWQDADRRTVENQVGRAIAGLQSDRPRLPADAVTELAESATRVMIARRFFNDAVRDTRTLRARRMPRLLWPQARSWRKSGREGKSATSCLRMLRASS